MQIQLRDYQFDLEARTGQALRRVKRVLMQCPPGGGKTAIATSMLSKFAARGDTGWFICHRAELVEQTSKTFSRYDLPHGFVVSGYDTAPTQVNHICSIDTLKNRLGALKAPRIALVDECHHSGAAGWAAVIRHLHEAGTYIVGLSGTPHRHDGTGLDAHFDELVLGPSVAWLMEHGHLAQYRIFAPDKPDRKAISKMAGEFNRKDAASAMSKPKLMGNIVGHWKDHARGMLSVGFGCNVQHSMLLAEQFRAHGINAIHLDGKTKKNERRAMIQDIGPGGIEVVFNVGLFGEGFDLSAIAQRDITIDAVIDAAPGMSLPWNIQKHMRCMRPNGDLVKVILDHAGNSDVHGFPEDEQHWKLAGRDKSAAANDNAPPPPVTCEGCWMQIRRPLPDDCPYCGKRLHAVFEAPKIDETAVLKAREEADKKIVRERRKAEENACADLGAFAALGRKRGNPEPFRWAQQRMSARMGKRMKETTLRK